MGHRAKSPILVGIFLVSILVLISLVTQAEAGVIIGEQYYDYYCPMCNQVFTLPGGGIAFFDQYGNLGSTAWSSSFPTPSPYIPSDVPNITQPEPEPLPFLICKPSLISVEDLYVPDDVTGMLGRMTITAWKQHHTLDDFEKNPNALEECIITITSGVGQQMDYSEELFPSKRDAENAYNQRIQKYPNEFNIRNEVHSVIPTPIGSNSILFLIKSRQPFYDYVTFGQTLIFQSGPYLISLSSTWNRHADGTFLGNWREVYDEKFLRDAADSVKKIIASSDSLVISKSGMTADITIPKCENALISLDEFRSIAGDNSYIAKSGDYIKFSKDYSMDNLQEILPLLDEFCQLVFEKKPNHNSEPTDQVVIWQLKWKSEENALKSYDGVLNVAKDDSKLAVAVGHMTANSFESVENDKTSNVFQKGFYTLIAAYTSVPGTIEKLSDSDFKEIVETVYDKIPGTGSSPQPTPTPQPTPPQPSPAPQPSPPPPIPSNLEIQFSLDECRTKFLSENDYAKFFNDHTMYIRYKVITPSLGKECGGSFSNLDHTMAFYYKEYQHDTEISAIDYFDYIMGSWEKESNFQGGMLGENSFLVPQGSVQGLRISFQQGDYTIMVSDTSKDPNKSLSENQLIQLAQIAKDRMPASNVPQSILPTPTPSPLLGSSQGIHQSNLRIIDQPGNIISSGKSEEAFYVQVDLENRGQAYKEFYTFSVRNDFDTYTYDTVRLQPGDSETHYLFTGSFYQPGNYQFDNYVLNQLPPSGSTIIDEIRFVKDPRNYLVPPLSINYQVTGTPTQEKNPNKIPLYILKNSGEDWLREGDESRFLANIEFLIYKDIIQVSSSSISQGSSSPSIPSWFKTYVDWWDQDLVSDEEIVKAVEFLLEERIIRVG